MISDRRTLPSFSLFMFCPAWLPLVQGLAAIERRNMSDGPRASARRIVAITICVFVVIIRIVAIIVISIVTSIVIISIVTLIKPFPGCIPQCLRARAPNSEGSAFDSKV